MKKIKLLLAAMAAMVTMGVNAQSWVASEVGAGDFVLYNVGTGQYFTKGNGWGTQASITSDASPASGMTLTLEAVDDNYKIITNVNGTGYGVEHLNGGTIYTDQSRGKNSSWTFTQVGTDNGPVYTIVSADNHGGGAGVYMTAGVDGTIVTPGADGTIAGAKWKLLDADKIPLLAKMAEYYSIKDAVEALDDDATIYTGDATVDVSAADAAFAEATTLEAINAAISLLRTAAADFITSVTLKEGEYFNVTNVWVVNPTVSVNVDGWNVENVVRHYDWSTGPTTNFGETEFYQSGFDFNQSVTLPAGTWEFGVSGFHRAGTYQTYFYAGEDRIILPGETSDVVNSMADAQTYFNNGNGLVSLKFLLESQSNTIKIGIINEDTGTDRWTIFRNFTLKYYGAPDYSIYVTRLAELAEQAAAIETTVPAAVYAILNGVVTEYNTSHANKAEYIAAIEAVEAAIATAKTFQSAYASYATFKAQVEAMKTVEGLEETTSGAVSTLEADIANADEALEEATTTDAIDAQKTALRAAGKTFLAGVRSDGEHPFNITFLINNPSFDNNNAEGWNAEPAPGFQSYTNCEYYQKEFDINQTLSDMPKGNYELKVQAFQRPGWWDAVYADYQNGINNVSSVIYINDGQTTIKNLVSEGATDVDHQWASGNDSNNGTVYFANSMNGAAQAFKAGYYWNTVLTNVEGDLTFGFKSTKTHVSGDWTIFDNFQLYYYGQSINVAMDEAEAFAALADIEGANVTMTRNTKVGYNTVALPFDLDEDQVVEFFGEGAVVYAYSEDSENADDVTIEFTTKDPQTIEANVPVLVKATKAVSEITADNVTVETGEAKAEGTNFDFVGNYAGEITIPEGEFFIGNDAVYKSEGSTTIKGFRAYLKAKTGNEVKAIRLFINGQDYTTAILGADAAPAQDGPIYNIAGQRVSKAQKGVYVVGGKKVVVK